MEHSVEFVLRVNEIFHDVEGKSYENNHPEIFKAEIERWKRFGYMLLPKTRRHPVRFLDLGSGTGFVPLTVASYLNKNDLFICSDISQEKINICRENVRNQEFACSFKYIKLTGDTIPVESGSIDFVSINSVLHHIPNFRMFFSEINRLLKVGSKVVIGHEPNKLHYQNKLLLFSKAILSVFVKPRDFFVAILRKLHLLTLARNLFQHFNEKTKNNNNILDQVNDRLLKEGLVSQPLTLDQLTEIVDIHSPNAGGSFHKDRGIDIFELVKIYLTNFEVEHFETYGYLSALQDRCSFLNKCEVYFKKKYPNDGENCGAFLIKKSE